MCIAPSFNDDEGMWVTFLHWLLWQRGHVTHSISADDRKVGRGANDVLAIEKEVKAQVSLFLLVGKADK